MPQKFIEVTPQDGVKESTDMEPKAKASSKKTSLMNFFKSLFHFSSNGCSNGSSTNSPSSLVTHTPPSVVPPPKKQSVSLDDDNKQDNRKDNRGPKFIDHVNPVPPSTELGKATIRGAVQNKSANVSTIGIIKKEQPTSSTESLSRHNTEELSDAKADKSLTSAKDTYSTCSSPGGTSKAAKESKSLIAQPIVFSFRATPLPTTPLPEPKLSLRERMERRKQKHELIKKERKAIKTLEIQQQRERRRLVDINSRIKRLERLGSYSSYAATDSIVSTYKTDLSIGQLLARCNSIKERIYANKKDIRKRIERIKDLSVSIAHLRLLETGNKVSESESTSDSFSEVTRPLGAHCGRIRSVTENMQQYIPYKYRHSKHEDSDSEDEKLIRRQRNGVINIKKILENAQQQLDKR